MEKEQNLPQRQPKQEISLTASKRAIRVAEKLIDVNMLVSFKLDGEEILSWSMELDRLLNNEQLEKLPFLMDAFKRNEIIWDKTIGIQNVFIGLKQIIKNEEGQFKILKNLW